MTEKPKRQASPPRPAPKITEAREDANSRTTLDVDPAWLEKNRASLDRLSPSPDRPSLDRRTMDVDPNWLERDTQQPAEEAAEARPRSAIPPPLPVTPKDDDEDVEEEPVRSAIPPPLPRT